MLKNFKKKGLLIALPVLIIVTTLYYLDSIRRFSYDTLPIVVGVSTKLACSGVYLMERDENEVIEQDIAPFYSPFLMSLIYFDFNDTLQTTTGTFFGLVSRTALYRPGVGCTLLIENTREDLIAQAQGIKAKETIFRKDEWPLGDFVNVNNSSNTRLDKAIDGAFEDTTPKSTLDTRAVIVVHNGKIIAQRFADGFDANSRFLSWSASKSIVSALIGTMVDDKKLTLHAPAPIAEWESKNDHRGDITLHHLLTMTSGLEFSEPYIPRNNSVTMLFSKANMGNYAAHFPLESQPGNKWYYSSGTTNILSRILFEQSGGSLKSVHQYAWKHLFDPVGMTSATFEPDASGSFVGSSYFYATAQDWARFGLLFLNEGKVGDKQVLSKEWVRYSQTPTSRAPLRQYGAQFWLNAGDPINESNSILPDVPKDTYMAQGHNGQFIAIIPSKNAVVLRLGWSTTGTTFNVNKHFSNILAALPDNSN